MRHSDIFWLILVISRISDGQNLAHAENAEGRIIRMLTTKPGYEKQARPVLNSSEPIYVSLTFTPTILVELNDEKQRISVAAYFDQYWKDEYLTWDPGEYEGLTRIVLPNHALWTPDTFCTDSQGGIDDISTIIGGFNLVVEHDGNVVWYSSRVFKKACNLNMQLFPYDRQICYFNFESRTQARAQLQLKVVNDSDTLDLNVLLLTNDGQWRFENSSAEVRVKPFSEWSEFVATLTLARKPSFFIINILGPCLLMSLLIPVMFYLPPDSGERMSMGVTILLSFTVFQMVVADALPKTSENCPLLVIYLTILMALSAASVILNVIVLHIHLRGGATMPKSIRFLLFDGLAKVLLMSIPQESQSHAEMTADNFKFENKLLPGRVKSGNEYPTVEKLLEEILSSLKEFLKMKNDSVKKELSRDLWLEAARVLDRFFMILYVVISIVAACVFFSIGRLNS